MPARIARSSAPVAQPKTARNKNRKRHLDAFAIAGHDHADRVRVKQHRLGELLDDGPRNKRRKVQPGAEDEDESDFDQEQPQRTARKSQSRRQARDGDDSIEEGSDSEGNEWTLGGLAEDDDDSDLDSDEAFGESDEERFEGFTFRGSSKSKPKPSKPLKGTSNPTQNEINLDEDEIGDDEEDEDIEDDFGDEAVDLATMLDGSDDEDVRTNDRTDDDEDESSGSDSDNSMGSDNEGRNARILDLANDYGADTNAQPDRDQSRTQSKLTAADLLAGFDTDSRREAEKSIKPKKKIASETLSAPLPKRQQDKLDRQVASQKAKEQLDRWRDTVVQNRRAEFLQFPLNSSQGGAPSVNKEKFTPATQEAPSTELEANIRKIMEESGLATSKEQGENTEDAEDGLLKAEALATKKMPVEEARKRIAELRRQRDLLFREEIKAKRIKNIKSKAYRRVHRKQREKQAEEEAAFFDADGEPDEEERERRDRKRAEARMGTKHKDSKWARSLKATNRTAWDDDARDAVLENARRQDELRRRIAGDDISEGSSLSDGDDELDADEDITKTVDRLAAQQQPVPEKGLGAMKFMQNEDARRKAQNDEDIERMRRDLAIADGELEESEKEEDEGLGRAIFGPRSQEPQRRREKAQRPELEEGSASDDSDGGLAPKNETKASKAAVAESSSTKPKSILKKVGGAMSKEQSATKSPLIQSRQTDPSTEAESSWLSGEPNKKGKDKKRRDEDTLALTVKPSIVSNGEKQALGSSKAITDDGENGANAGNTEGWTTVAYHNGDNDQDSEDEPDDRPLLTKEQQKADFHRRAFAGDDVHLSFSAEKAAAEDSEDEKVESNHLPGWGSWAGEGLSKRTKKHNARIKHNPLHKHKIPGGTAKANRKDKGREDVIISEKNDKKGAIYKAKVLPHGFETKDQYERSLRMPIGPEWSTKEVFQRSTKPRVVVKPGQVIEAIERPMV